MHQRKSKKILVYFFLLIIFSSINNYSINNFKLNKNLNINISGLDEKNNQIILKEIRKLNYRNIFLIKKNEIIKLIDSNSLVEKYNVIKKYPSTINIKIKKTSFFAKININGKIFLIGSNGKLTLMESNHGDLPFIFGSPNANEFLRIKKTIEESKFSYNEIKDLYFFPSKRWDLKFKDDILLRLPINFTNETLNRIYELLINYDGESLRIVDARVENQIIFNE